MDTRRIPASLAGVLAVFVVFANSACANADTASSGSFQRLYTFPPVPRQQAVAVAARYTGLPAEAVVAADPGQATDAYNVLLDVSAREVWQVVFQGVSISATDHSGAEGKNPSISTINVWVDANTGVPLKVFSPKPASGGLKLIVSPEEKSELSTNGLKLKPGTSPPPISFVQAIRSAEDANRGMALRSSEVVAYFGLLTDSLRLHNGVVDRPYWVIFADGIDQPVSRPPGAPEIPSYREGVVFVDAESGEWYLEFLVSAGTSGQK
jgi:hypothetical protein